MFRSGGAPEAAQQGKRKGEPKNTTGREQRGAPIPLSRPKLTLAAAAISCLPTAVEPVKPILRTVSLAVSAWPVVLLSSLCIS